jgi:hypothetical protein
MGKHGKTEANQLSICKSRLLSYRLLQFFALRAAKLKFCNSLAREALNNSIENYSVLLYYDFSQFSAGKREKY